MTKKKTTDTTATAEKWIAYYRVSTKRQNLGLDAQRARVQAAAAAQGAEIIAEIEEKESGRECNRQGLNRAMAEARRHGATIAVAKHDRLSRDLAFAAEMVFKSGIAFKILNLPAEAMTDKLLFAVYFGLAAQEAQLISDRTKAALSALKAKGVQLGRPNAAEHSRRQRNTPLLRRAYRPQGPHTASRRRPPERIRLLHIAGSVPHGKECCPTLSAIWHYEIAP